MEVAYSTLDLAMLVIAAFVIWLAKRTPIVEPSAEEENVKALRRTKTSRPVQLVR
jgi:hypothetical protein